MDNATPSVGSDAMTRLITRRVPVSRSLTPQEVLDTTGCKQYTRCEIVDSMPRGQGNEAEVIFFQPRPEAYKDGLISDDDLKREFEHFKLDSAFPDDVAAVNAADLSFSDSHPNGTHWKDAKGNWCYIAFDRWDDERHVRVYRCVSDWDDDWWFAGRRK